MDCKPAVGADGEGGAAGGEVERTSAGDKGEHGAKLADRDQAAVEQDSVLRALISKGKPVDLLKHLVKSGLQSSGDERQDRQVGAQDGEVAAPRKALRRSPGVENGDDRTGYRTSEAQGSGIRRRRPTRTEDEGVDPGDADDNERRRTWFVKYHLLPSMHRLLAE
jgi:hypothetical protein